jgi:rhodanese-related sulfurtransferase
MTDLTQLEPVAQRVPLGISADLAHDDGAVAKKILERARERAPEGRPGYAGAVTPVEAWALVEAGAATLVDVRTPEERQFVGYVPQSVHVPWAFGANLQRNQRFLRDLESRVGRDQVLLFLCRSGGRSLAAAQAATEARYRSAFNVLEGFEGELDRLQRRSSVGGWKFHELPWVQD